MTTCLDMRDTAFPAPACLPLKGTCTAVGKDDSGASLSLFETCFRNGCACKMGDMGSISGVLSSEAWRDEGELTGELVL